MNYYSFHIGDYASKTRHLTWDQDLSYRRLIEIYYAYELPLPLDRQQVYRLVSVQSSKHKRAVDSVISEFFQEFTDGYHHIRCDEEIATAKEKRTKAAKSARIRWDAEAIRTQSEGNAPNPNPNPNPKSSSEERDAFDEFDAALRKIEGVGNHPVYANPVIAPVWQLLQQGYDLKTQIAPSIRRQLQNINGKRITTWAYFVPGIVEDAKPVRAGFVQQVPEAKWASRMGWARKHQQWGAVWGPMPGQSGCAVPASLLKPTDGQGWTEWRPTA